MKNTFKLKDNLFMIGNDIISYETHVATIDGDKIIEHGKYSKTTSKHISYVAELLKLEVVPNKTKMKNQFDKLQYGVRCFVDSAISKSSSLKILSKMINEGVEYKYALLALERAIPKKDWNLLDKRCLDGVEEDERLGVRALMRVGAF